jgi:outer membrane lipoprotein carrier protein
MRLLILPALATLMLPAALPAARQEPARTRPAEEVALEVQQRYDRIRDFSAAFEHTYEGGALRRKAVERGTVQIKKPARMRWEYREPEKKLFVADGSQIYSYIPADRQVIVSPVPTEDQATTAVLFLTGKGHLTRDFDVRYAEELPPGAPADSLGFTLIPRTAERDYDTLTLVVDARTLQIRMLAARDRQGGHSSFSFSGIKENTGLADNLFAFKIPRGTDVIRSGSSPQRP